MSGGGIATDDKELAAAVDHGVRREQVGTVGDIQMRRAAEIREAREQAGGITSRSSHESIRSIKDQPGVHDQKPIKRERLRLPASTLPVAVPALRGTRIPVSFEYHMRIAVRVADHV